MSPTERQLDRGILARFDQVAEPGIAIHLQGAPERSQVCDRVFTPAVLGVDIGRYRMRWTSPRSIVDRIAPEPSGLGPASTGLEHRQRCLITLSDDNTVPSTSS